MRADEREGMLDLWSHALDDVSAERAPARYDWFYGQSPGGAPFTLLGVVEGQGERPVGCASLLARRFDLVDAEADVGVAVDLGVRAEHRVAGCALVMQRALLRAGAERGFPFLYGYPNKKAYAVLARAGWRAVGDAVAYAKPLRSGERLAGYAKDPRVARVLAHPLAGRVAAALVDVGLGAVDAARAAPGLLRFRPAVVDRADARFDALWAARTERRIQGARTADWLAWRFAGKPHLRHRILTLTARASGQLAGFVAYSTEKDTGFVVDLFARDFGPTLEALLLHLALRLRFEGMRTLYLTYFGDERLGALLRRLVFFRREMDRKVIAYVPPGADPGLAARVFDPGAWLLFESDMDI